MVILEIEKAKSLVDTLRDDAVADSLEDRWTYALVPTPDGLKAKVEVRDADGVFISYM